MMDWDKLRVFHAVAEAGSFTHAGEDLNLSQSAVSRQISGLEETLGVTLFHRHARGLMLTEQGELLHRTTREILARLTVTEGMLSESKDTPKGPLKITTTMAFGSSWLAQRIGAFHRDHPELELTLLISDEELDLSMRQADVAIRFNPPRQPDLIQRTLATFNFHLYAAPEYIERRGMPENREALGGHTLLAYPPQVRGPFPSASWLIDFVQPDRAQMKNLILMSNMLALRRAVEAGAGIAVLPDFLALERGALVKVLPDVAAPQVEARFVYPEEMRHSKRIAVFRDFLIEQLAQTAV